MNAKFVKIFDADCALGESPVWLAQERLLVFVDIKGRRIFHYEPADGRVRRFDVDEEIGCIAPCRGGGFVGGARSGVWLLDADGAKRRMLCANPENVEVSRFNDGKVDPAGRYVLGTMDETKSHATAGLYRLDRRGLTQLASGLMTSNGVAFSPSGNVLYHADTPRFVVWRRDYQVETGEAGPPEPFIRLDAEAADRARPDGGAIDASGCYWSALYDGGRVHRYDPDGRLMGRYLLAARRPTMPAFGGSDLKTLFVTTAADEAGAGALYALDADVSGAPIPHFDPSV